MNNNKIFNRSSIVFNKYAYQFDKLNIRKAKGDNFISNFYAKKLEIQNRTRELLLSGSVTSRDDKDNPKQELKQNSRLIHHKLNMKKFNDKNGDYTCKAFGLDDSNNNNKRKLFEINDEIKRKRLIFLKHKISLLNKNRLSISSLMVNNKQAKTLKSSHSDSLFLTKLSNNYSPFQSTSTHIPLPKNLFCRSSGLIFKPKIRSGEFKQMIENSLQQSLENNSLLRNYSETQKKYVYRTRNINNNKQKRTQPIDCHSQMNLFKDIKTGKRVVFTQGLSNLINFGDYFNRMSDVHCYHERAYIKKIYPLIQQGVNPNSNKPLMKRNNSTKNVELEKISRIVERSEELLNRIKLKKELLKQ